LFEGYAAGPNRMSGSASNYLCLPEHPQWNTYRMKNQISGTIYGVEYELEYINLFSEANNGGNPLQDNPAPCAVCYVGGRSTVIMLPAKTQCLDGWTTEYQGYLVSNADGYQATTYICWDEAPEVAVGGINQNKASIFHIEVHCGSLPCSVYGNGKELACVVCSK